MKTLFKTLGMLGLFFFLLGNVGWATTYYSKTTASNPNSLANWGTNADGSGTAPTSFTTGGHTYIITNGTTMTTTAAWTIGGLTSQSNLTIKNGGVLYATYAVTIGKGTSPMGLFTIETGGTYYQQNNSAYSTSIFKGAKSFADASNFIINATSTSLTTNVTFGNLTIDLTVDPMADVNFGAWISQINGNFELKNSQGRKIIFSQSTTYSLNVGGNFKISGGILDFSNGTNTTDKTFTLNLQSNFEQTGGTFTHTNNTYGSSLNINFITSSGKSFTQSGGTFENTYMNFSVDPDNGTFTFNDNFTLLASRSFIVYSGSVNVAAAKTLTINGVLEMKKDVDYGHSKINGSGSFALGSSGTIKTTSPDGIASSGSSGSIQVSGTRTFHVQGSYEYNGTVTQATGSGVTICNNITCNNPGGITLSNGLTVNGTLAIMQGTISLNSNVLTYGSEATLKYNGNGLTTGEEFSETYSPVNLEVSTGADVILSQIAILSGSATINGTLDFGLNIIYGNQRTFQINGTVITANPYGLDYYDEAQGLIGSILPIGGSISYSIGASYVYNGTEAQLTNANFSTCNNITVDNPAGVTIVNGSNTSLTVNGTMDLKQGEFILNNKNLTLNGYVTYSGAIGTGTITSTNQSALNIGGTAGGSLGTLKFTPNYNIIKSLTLNRTGDLSSATLGSDLIIDGSTNGIITLTSGEFIITGKSVTLYTTDTPILRNGSSQTGTITAGSGSTINFGTETYQGGSAFTIPSGTFTNSEVYNLTENRTNSLILGSNLTVNGALTLTSGVFTINAKSLTLNGTLARTSGTITGDNTANISIGGSGSLGSALIFTTGSEYLGTMLINRTTSGTVTLGSNLNINGTVDATTKGVLTLTDGNLNVESNTLTFINGNTPIVRTSGTITTTSYSNLIFGTEGNTGGAVFSIPDGTFSGTPTVSTFSINRTNSLTLSQDLNVNSTLNLTSGLLIANLVTLGSSTTSIGSLSVDTTASRIVGMFKRYISTSETIYRFPVGTLTNYNGIFLYYPAAPTTGGSLTAKFILGDPGNHTVQVLTDASTTPNYHVDRYSNHGYWNITNNGGTVAGSYAIFLNANGFPGISSVDSSRAQLRIIKRIDSNNDWSLLGSHSCASGSTSCLSVKRTCLTSFSDFAIGSSYINNSFDGPLPVKLSSFSSNVISRNVSLTWKTNSEINNSGFDIERKTSDGTWSKVGFVKGKGTTNNATTYNFNDMKLNTGKYNYRLKQIDNNGNFEYHNLSGTVEVGVPKNYELSQNYPNPFNPTTKIDFALPFDSKVHMLIYDITGREVKTLVNDSRQAGYHTVELNASMMSSGTYFFRIIANANGKDFISTKKMVLVK